MNTHIKITFNKHVVKYQPTNTASLLRNKHYCKSYIFDDTLIFSLNGRMYYINLNII